MIDTKELRRLALDGDLAAMQEIILRLKAAETDAAHQKTLAESALRVAEGWERKCDALRAKITEMKKQEPVRHEFQGRDGDWYPFINQRHYENTVADGTWPIRALYALPGAQAQPAPSVPDGVAEALQRLIENGAVLGPSSSEDALLVARYRQHLLSSAPSISPAALRPVIQWLRNGCDPVRAADELEMLTAAPEAKP